MVILKKELIHIENDNIPELSPQYEKYTIKYMGKIIYRTVSLSELKHHKLCYRLGEVTWFDDISFLETSKMELKFKSIK